MHDPAGGNARVKMGSQGARPTRITVFTHEPRHCNKPITGSQGSQVQRAPERHPQVRPVRGPPIVN